MRLQDEIRLENAGHWSEQLASPLRSGPVALKRPIGSAPLPQWTCTGPEKLSVLLPFLLVLLPRRLIMTGHSRCPFFFHLYSGRFPLSSAQPTCLHKQILIDRLKYSARPSVS